MSIKGSLRDHGLFESRGFWGFETMVEIIYQLLGLWAPHLEQPPSPQRCCEAGAPSNCAWKRQWLGPAWYGASAQAAM